MVMAADRHFFEDDSVDPADKDAEVLEGDDADVRRVVPLVGKLLVARRGTGEEQLKTHAPMAEVREADDHFAAHCQQHLQQFFRIVDLL